MTRIAHSLLALILAAMAVPALAHGKLVNSTPSNGATLPAAPREIRFQFSEPVEPTFTVVKLLGPAGQDVATNKAHVDETDAKTVVVGLPGLSAGAYRARWSTMGHDGHRVKGEIGFTVK